MDAQQHSETTAASRSLRRRCAGLVLKVAGLGAGAWLSMAALHAVTASADPLSDVVGSVTTTVQQVDATAAAATNTVGQTLTAPPAGNAAPPVSPPQQQPAPQPPASAHPPAGAVPPALAVPPAAAQPPAPAPVIQIMAAPVLQVATPAVDKVVPVIDTAVPPVARTVAETAATPVIEAVAQTGAPASRTPANSPVVAPVVETTGSLVRSVHAAAASMVKPALGSAHGVLGSIATPVLRPGETGLRQVLRPVAGPVLRPVAGPVLRPVAGLVLGPIVMPVVDGLSPVIGPVIGSVLGGSAVLPGITGLPVSDLPQAAQWLARSAPQMADAAGSASGAVIDGASAVLNGVSSAADAITRVAPSPMAMGVGGLGVAGVLTVMSAGAAGSALGGAGGQRRAPALPAPAPALSGSTPYGSASSGGDGSSNSPGVFWSTGADVTLRPLGMQRPHNVALPTSVVLRYLSFPG